MPNLPISQLPKSTLLQGDELFVDVQGGITKYTSLDDITGYTSGSVMVTGSLSGTNLVFEKGDSSTFSINLSSTFVQSAYISLYSSASQVLAVSGSAQAVTFTSIWAESGISLVDGTKITMAQPGVYQFNFVAQVNNSDNAVHDSWFWIKYNGSNFPNSSTQMTLNPRKSSSEPSAQLMTMNIVGVNTVANGYIELYWTGDKATTTSLNETPAYGPVPETPSIIANIVRVG